MRPDESKIVLEGPGPDPVWLTLYERYGCRDPVRLKRLAMLALREECNWPLEWIGDVFAHHKGHVSRSLKRTNEELKQLLDINLCRDPKRHRDRNPPSPVETKPVDSARRRNR